MALLECCTKEGNRKFPSFVAGKNLHHFQPRHRWYQPRHPHCNIAEERALGNKTLSCTSRSDHGRFMIVLMGLNKWIGNQPQFNFPVTYKQTGSSYGDQLEILSLTLRDKIYRDSDWLLDADQILDVLDYWKDHDAVIQVVTDCGLTPIPQRVREFCSIASNSNQEFLDKVSTCRDVVNWVIEKKDHALSLDFFQVAICHSMLLQNFGVQHQDVLLFQTHPTHTKDFMEIFDV